MIEDLSAPEMGETAPYAVLGLEPGASEIAIRDAYIAKVKQFPPDRSPAEFERVRDAYEYLRDPKRRACQLLNVANPFIPFPSLLDSTGAERRHVGPGPWLAVLKEK